MKQCKCFNKKNNPPAIQIGVLPSKGYCDLGDLKLSCSLLGLTASCCKAPSPASSICFNFAMALLLRWRVQPDCRRFLPGCSDCLSTSTVCTCELSCSVTILTGLLDIVGAVKGVGSSVRGGTCGIS